jgi:quercetin dioxygenase-like cupin family protein
MTRPLHRALVVTPVILAVLAGAISFSGASAPSGVTPTLLARGEFNEFSVKSDRDGPIDLQAKSRTPVDLVIRQHSYAPGSWTGWHSHPGPVFITVTKGSLTFYEYVDGQCLKKVLTATADHQPGYVDSGRGHLVRNESGAPAEDISVITAPRKPGVFRSELDIPNGCGF